ncbi:6-bladed beta-propeller [Aurantivibrio infirmus]
MNIPLQKSNRISPTLIVVAVLVLFCGQVFAQSVVHPPGPNHGEDPYNVVKDWLQPFAEPGFVWGSQPGIFVESPDRIFIIQRGELHVPDPKPEGFTYFYGSAEGLSALQPVDKKREMRNVIFIVDSAGKLVESWTQWDYLFANTAGPHKIAINPFDPERKIWVVNDLRHQIHVFSNDGEKLLFSLGTWSEAGNDETHFGRPQDLTFLKDGSILVADGIVNSRVVKFDKNGKYLMEWGSKGSADGEFDVVHGIAADKNNRIYVADRSNDRVQVFDEMGKHLATWPNLNFPNHIVITENQEVWVADNQPVRIVKFNTDGERLYSWDADGRGDGEFAELHEFGIDMQGNWYGADNLLGRSLKFTPKPNAKKDQLMSKPVSLAEND